MSPTSRTAALPSIPIAVSNFETEASSPRGKIFRQGVVMASPVKQFNFRFAEAKQNQQKFSEGTLSTQAAVDAKNIIQQIRTNFSQSKVNQNFDVDEVFSLGGIVNQPNPNSDQYVEKKLELELQAAQSPPRSI